MKSKCLLLINLLVLHYLAVLCVSQDFDFFYFVQQVSGLIDNKSFLFSGILLIFFFDF